MEIKAEEWGRVKELFLAALDVELSSRRRFLAQTGDSEELCLTVEELLLAHEKAGPFLHPHAAFAETFSSGAGQNRLTVGSMLVDRFQVLRFIAQGGMGEVYEAQDVELEARIALKTIRPEIAASPQILARFKREVHLAKDVTHPNVCRVFDLFRHRSSSDPASDIIFVSMEFLNGQTLAERIKQGGRMSTEEVLRILRQIVPALGAIHASGILHRDLKPSNIVLEPDRAGGLRAVITDFGMAWSLDSSSRESLTGSGQLVFGTPEYMSPEQIEGGELTPASDLYSLGLVIYQMITGVRAFSKDTPLFSALRRLKESPPVPSRIVPELGRRWDTVISCCLYPDPACRFSSAQQVLDALDETAKPVPRRPRRRHSAGTRPSRFTRRWELAASAVCIGAVLIGATLFFLHRRRKISHKSGLTIVLADFVNTTGEPVFDRTLNVALKVKLEQSPLLNLMSEDRVRLALRYMGLPANQRLTKAFAQQACQREGGQVVLQGTIASGTRGYDLWLRSFACASGKNIASEVASAGDQNSALTALDRLADSARKELGESSESIRRYDVPLKDASTGSMAALTAYSQGLQASNEQGEFAAVPYFRQATEIDPNFAIAYARLASIYWDRGDLNRARQAATQAYERRDRVTEWERFFILSSYYAFATGELDKEMRTYEEWSRIYPHDTHWPLGLCVDDSYFGKYEQSAEMARLEIHNGPEIAATYGNLALAYLSLNRPDEARAILAEADRAHLHEINMDWARYWMAFSLNDTAGMNQVVSQETAYPGLRQTLLIQQAKTAAYHGRLQASRKFAEEVSDGPVRSDDTEIESLSQAEEGLWEAEFGKSGAAQTDVSHALSEIADHKSKDVQIVAALALATIGEEHQAQAMTVELKQTYPLDTMLNQYWLPIVSARIALHRGEPEQADKLLESATPYETGIFNPLPCMYSVYVRGQAHLAMGRGVQAAADFREILNHRGVVFNCPTGALSQLDLARSLALTEDISGSRTAYQDLFAFWKDADKHLGLVRQARAEYAAAH